MTTNAGEDVRENFIFSCGSLEINQSRSSQKIWQHGDHRKGLKGRGEKRRGAEKNVQINRINLKMWQQ